MGDVFPPMDVPPYSLDAERGSGRRCRCRFKSTGGEVASVERHVHLAGGVQAKGRMGSTLVSPHALPGPTQQPAGSSCTPGASAEYHRPRRLAPGDRPSRRSTAIPPRRPHARGDLALVHEIHHHLSPPLDRPGADASRGAVARARITEVLLFHGGCRGRVEREQEGEAGEGGVVEVFWTGRMGLARVGQDGFRGDGLRGGRAGTRSHVMSRTSRGVARVARRAEPAEACVDGPRSRDLLDMKPEETTSVSGSSNEDLTWRVETFDERLVNLVSQIGKRKSQIVNRKS